MKRLSQPRPTRQRPPPVSRYRAKKIERQANTPMGAALLRALGAPPQKRQDKP